MVGLLFSHPSSSILFVTVGSSLILKHCLAVIRLHILVNGMVLVVVFYLFQWLIQSEEGGMMWESSAVQII